jgi:hypothetical protein
MAYEESPAANLNKGYAKQEKSDLMNDNPVARDASGGRPWISRHFRSSMGGSPLMELKGDQVKLDKNKNGEIDGEDFKMMKK